MTIQALCTVYSVHCGYVALYSQRYQHLHSLQTLLCWHHSWDHSKSAQYSESGSHSHQLYSIQHCTKIKKIHCGFKLNSLPRNQEWIIFSQIIYIFTIIIIIENLGSISDICLQFHLQIFFTVPKNVSQLVYNTFKARPWVWESLPAVKHYLVPDTFHQLRRLTKENEWLIYNKELILYNNDFLFLEINY